MIIYSSSVAEFKEAVDENQIAPKIEECFVTKLGKRPSVSEWRSWNNSMQFMERIIRNSKVAEDCGVMIEYNIPSTSKRIDFIIAGKDEQDKDHFIIVELKQWESARATDKEDVVITVLGGSTRETTHPSYQAWSYRQFMYDMNEAVYTRGVEGHSVAFLHNYREKQPEPLKSPLYEKTVKEAPLFFSHETRQLQDFIYKYVGRGKGMKLLYEIEHGKIIPSKSLIDHVNSLFEGHSDFVLLDEQKVAYETIMSLARKQDKKRTLIIKGGPGTGKSVLSMNALGGLLREKLNTKFVAPNASFRNVMVEMLTKQSVRSKIRTKSLFMGSGSFVDAARDEFDVLIVDEAHRLKGKGTYMYSGVNQIEDIIKSSKINVFFIDDHQRIRPDDIGSIAEVKRAAAEYGSEVYEYALTAQFRCSGADGFLNWIDDVFGIRETANYGGWNRDTFDFQIMDSPHDVYTKVKEMQNEGRRARLLAGYAWNWSNMDKDGRLIDDVSMEEHDFHMPWNSRSISTTWAVHPEGINQVGCVHTTQGLEFDYVGVLIGNDLTYDSQTGELGADYIEYKDRTGKKGLKNNPQELTKLIKNIYKVLMTRGMKGCYVFCRDAELRAYLQERLARAK